MRNIDLELQTLTPLWTGAVETGKMQRIQESGILGSLRWWYEAIIRGLGGAVCNPTSDKTDERCPRSEKQQKEGKQEYCDVCQLFGATGKSRGFRLRIENREKIPRLQDFLIPSGRIHEGGQGKTRAGGWYIMADSVMANNISFQFIPLRSVPAINALQFVLFLIERHASIAAKVASGYGVIKLSARDMLPASTSDMLQAVPADAQPSRSFVLPDIRDFFFAKIQFSEPQNNANWWHSIEGIRQGMAGSVIDTSHNPPLTKRLRPISEDLYRLVDHQCIPLAPAVRNWLRFKWFPTRFHSGRAPVVLEKYLFGYASNQGNQASKINVSHAYKTGSIWEFRIWGWLPCQSPESIRIDRDQLLSDLRNTLNDTATWQWIFNGSIPEPEVTEWHQLDYNNRDGRDYLEKLLGLKQEQQI